MGCTFCATGAMGIKGDLTAGEIVEQLVHAQRVTPIRNVVFMVRTLSMNCQQTLLWHHNLLPGLIPVYSAYLH